MIIRTEQPGDYDAVFRLNYEAFGKRENESRLVERISRSDRFVPELSLVAERDGELVGHVLLSKADVIEGERGHEVIVLAPVGVLPECQKQGIGSALIREGLKRSREAGYGLVLLIGHPSYYPRFGFKPARQYGLELTQYKVPDNVFMVCELKEGILNQVKGELRYPPAFFG